VRPYKKNDDVEMAECNATSNLVGNVNNIIKLTGFGKY
jgi:hypothetical protein